MFGIYKYECGLQFTGLVAATEEEAWAYLDKTYGKEIYGHRYGVSRNGAWAVKELKMVKG